MIILVLPEAGVSGFQFDGENQSVSDLDFPMIQVNDTVLPRAMHRKLLILAVATDSNIPWVTWDD